MSTPISLNKTYDISVDTESLLTDTLAIIDSKQNQLIAGDKITLVDNTISVSGNIDTIWDKNDNYLQYKDVEVRQDEIRIMSTTYSSNISNDMLVWYKFNSDGLTNDASGNNRTLTNSNTISDTTDNKTGDAAVRFTNGNSFLQVANTNGIFTKKVFSISLWFKSPSTHSIHQTLASARAHVRGWAIYIDPNSNNLSFLYGNNRSTWDGINLGTFSFNTWTHICLTLNNSLLKFYINGALTNTSQLNNFLEETQITITQMCIGKVNDNLYYLKNDTLMDDFRFYNMALSSTDTKIIYENTKNKPYTGPTDSLLLWYKFDGNYDDYSDGGNHLTNNNSTINNTLQRTGTGCAYFDGSGHCALPTMNFGKGKAISFSSWFRFNSNTLYQRVFDFGNGAENNNILIGRVSDSIYVSVLNNGNNTSINLSGICTISNNTFYHIAIILQQTGTSGTNTNSIIIYINGVSKYQSQTFRYPLYIESTKNYLGKSNWSENPNLNGYIDDFRIYTRALTETEVKQIYEYKENYEYKSYTGPQDNLIAWYKFDGIFLDTSGNGYDLTNTNVTFNNIINPTGTNCAYFNGNAQYCTLPNTLNFGAYDAISICCWFRIDATLQGYTNIFDFGLGENNNNITLSINGSTNFNILIFGVRNGTNVDDYEICTIKKSTYYHIVIVIINTGTIGTLSNTLKIFINGDLFVITSNRRYPTNIPTGYTKCYLGRSNWNSTPYINGFIDDFRIYSRALSESDVKEIHGYKIKPIVNYDFSEDPMFNTTLVNKGIGYNMNGTIVNSTSISGSLAYYPGTTDGLIAWYKFDGNYTDSSGNDKPLSNNNSTINTTLQKRGTGCVSFNGSTQYCTLPSTINFGGYNQISIVCWFRINATSTNVSVFDFGNGQANNSIILSIDASSNLILSIYYNAVVSYSTILSNINYNNFYHIAIVMTKNTGVTQPSINNTLKVYINGFEMTTTNTLYPQSFPSGYTNCYLGKSNWTANNYLNGYIDDFRIFNRVLTSSEVMQMFGFTITRKTGYKTPYNYNWNGIVSDISDNSYLVIPKTTIDSIGKSSKTTVSFWSKFENINNESSICSLEYSNTKSLTISTNDTTMNMKFNAKDDRLTKYPRFPILSANAKQNTTLGTFSADLAFNHIISDSIGQHSTLVYSNGDYTSSGGFTDYKGEWIMINIEEAFILKKIRFFMRANLPFRAPGVFRIYGTNDITLFNNGTFTTGWTLLHDQTDRLTDYVYQVGKDVEINNTLTFSIYVMVVNKLSGTGVNSDYLNFREWELYGTPEYEKFPRYPLTDSTTCKQSTYYTQKIVPTHLLFNGNIINDGSTGGFTCGLAQYNSSTGNANNLRSFDGYAGDWVIINTLERFALKKIKFYHRQDLSSPRSPGVFRIYGTNNVGLFDIPTFNVSTTDWTLIHEQTTKLTEYIYGKGLEVNIDNHLNFSIYILVVNQLSGTGGHSTMLNFTEWELFGLTKYPKDTLVNNDLVKNSTNYDGIYYYGFNNNVTDGSQHFATAQYTTTNGIAKNNRSFSGYDGDYVLVNMEERFVLSKIKIYPNTTNSVHLVRSPGKFRIYGTNDLSLFTTPTFTTGWTLIHDQTTLATYPSGVPFEVDIKNTEEFSIYIMVVNQLAGTGTEAYILNYSEWQLFGRPKYTKYPKYPLTDDNNVKYATRFDTNSTGYKLFDYNKESNYHDFGGFSQGGDGIGSTGIVGYNGGYIMINTEEAFVLNKVIFYMRLNLPFRCPGVFRIYGTNDITLFNTQTFTSGWTLLHDQKERLIDYVYQKGKEVLINNEQAFSIYALVVNKLSGTGTNSEYFNFAEWELYGIPAKVYETKWNNSLRLLGENIKFPRVPLINDNNVKQSTKHGSFGNYLAFNHNISDSVGQHCMGIYTMGNATTNYGFTNYDGDWIMINIGETFVLNKVKFYIRNIAPFRAPGVFRIYGTNDISLFNTPSFTSGWTLIHDQTERVTNYANGVGKEVLINNEQAFSIYVMVVNKLSTTAGDVLNFVEWELYGNTPLLNNYVFTLDYTDPTLTMKMYQDNVLKLPISGGKFTLTNFSFNTTINAIGYIGKEITINDLSSSYLEDFRIYNQILTLDNLNNSISPQSYVKVSKENELIQLEEKIQILYKTLEQKDLI